MDSFAVGNRIRTVRERAGLTQEAFAAKLGVTPTTIIRYEKNQRTPDIDFINQLVRLTGCDVGWLLTGREETSGITGGKGYDLGLMKEVIRTVEELFQAEGLVLKPEKKADLIILLYEELLEDETRKDELKGKIIKLTRLAS